MNKTAEDFQVCGKCKDHYARSVIRHHCRKCFDHDGKNQRVLMVQGRKIAAGVHPIASKDVRNKLYPYMNEDAVVKEIRYDELVMVYANQMAEKYGTQGQSYKQVRANLRLCGRFLIAIKQIDNRIKDFSDLFQPEFYDAVMRVVRVVTKYDEDTKLYGAPAVAFGYGTLLKKLAELLRNEYIKKKMSGKREEVDNFIKLLEVDYGISINRGVAETQAQNNRRKEVVLPPTEDIKKLHAFIKTERDKYYEKLTEKIPYVSWENLAKRTLLSFQIFNHRRPGEIERLFIEDFHSHLGLDHGSNQEAYDGLSEEGKKLSRKHSSACDLMREYSLKCGADAPETLRGTTLRKHIATKCIALNVTDGQVTDLANFTGQGLTPFEDESDDSSVKEHSIPRRKSNRARDNTGNGPSMSSSTTSNTSTGKQLWSDQERKTTLAAFGEELKLGRVPSGREMQEFIDKNSCMRARTVPQLRIWLWT
ncbi:uncharacterized protein [Fopius arisanus]|uniref:Uncharacterized protein n=1 Tax=Fopius arisanus TaxID=64838 RepID=A0A9R1TZB5_9HYME|nr:PREDICTED: uncharacterized protein LOC105266010 [Fopius arisanus]